MLSFPEIASYAKLGVLVAYVLLSVALMAITRCSRENVAQHCMRLAFALGVYYYGSKIGTVGSSSKGATAFKVAAVAIAFYYARFEVVGVLLRCEESDTPPIDAPAPTISTKQALQLAKLLTGYLDVALVMTSVVFAMSIVPLVKNDQRPAQRPVAVDPRQIDRVLRQRQSSTGMIRVKAANARAPPPPPQPVPQPVPQPATVDDTLIVLPPAVEYGSDDDVLGRLLG